MANSDEGSSNYPPRGSAPPLPSVTLTLSQVSDKIQDLRLELVDCTLRLGLVQAKYNKALTKGAHAARENAQLRQALEIQRQEYARL